MYGLVWQIEYMEKLSNFLSDWHAHNVCLYLFFYHFIMCLFFTLPIVHCIRGQDIFILMLINLTFIFICLIIKKKHNKKRNNTNQKKMCLISCCWCFLDCSHLGPQAIIKETTTNIFLFLCRSTMLLVGSI